MPESTCRKCEFFDRNVLQSISDGFARFEIITGNDKKPVDIVIHEANPSFESIIQLKLDDVSGKRLLDLYPEASEFLVHWMDSIINGLNEEASVNFTRFIPQIYKLVNFTVFREENGRYCTIFHEMGEYRQEAGVVKNMIDGIVYYQQVSGNDNMAHNFKVLNVNPAFLKMMHVNRENIIGKLITDIIPNVNGYHDVIVKSIKEVFDYGQPKTFEQFSRKLGKWFSITLFSPNEGYGAAVFTDITRYKLLENALIDSRKKAEEASIAKSDLLANISHELRTPLNVILSASQLLRLYIGNDGIYRKENAIRHINTMRQNCLRLIRLVNNILDSSKIESGLFALNIKNHNLINVIRKITESTEEYALMKGNKVVFRSNVDEKIMAFDMNAMERVILNLLSNAFKFSKKNGIITVSVKCENDNAFISVKDQGIGIPQDKLGEIFERFRQAGGLVARENEGSGLGLAIVKTLVEIHEGTITVKSKEGQGSEFIIKLPCRTIDEKAVPGTCSSWSERLVERINIEFSDIYL